MAALFDSAANALAQLLLTATSWSDVATSTGFSTWTIAAHTATPAAGTQLTSEAAYTSYARINASRSGTAFTVTGAAGTNDNALQFPTNTGSVSGTLTHISLGTGTSNIGVLYAAIGSPATVGTGFFPNFPINDLDFSFA